MELKKIRLIEESSLNTWPSLHNLYYDGWILRFSKGYTKRSNSVNPIYSSTLEIGEKIQHCELLYVEPLNKVIFKITPIVQPNSLDDILESKNYQKIDDTSVQKLDLALSKKKKSIHIHKISSKPDLDWIQCYCNFHQVYDKDFTIFNNFINKIQLPAIFVSIYKKHNCIGCGLGILDNGNLWIYNLLVNSEFRNMGIGTEIMNLLLLKGKAIGAKFSYLQVVKANTKALKLYSRIGYKEIYNYWYRIKLKADFQN